MLCVKGKNKLHWKKQVADFIIMTERVCEKEDRLNNYLCSLKIMLLTKHECSFSRMVRSVGRLKGVKIGARVDVGK